MQIHDLNQFVGPLGSNVFLPLDNGQDTGKLAFTDLFVGNSYKTLWTGDALSMNTPMDLNDGISNYDFLDFYYGLKSSNFYQVEYKRVPVAELSQNIGLDMMYDLGPQASFRNIYHYVAILVKMSDVRIGLLTTETWTWTGAHEDDAAVGDTNRLHIYRIDGIKTPGNSKGVVACHTVTLKAADWDDNAQTISVDDVTANNYILVAPDPLNYSDYASAGIYCASQGAGTLTFECSTTPSNDLLVNVAVIG